MSAEEPQYRKDREERAGEPVWDSCCQTVIIGVPTEAEAAWVCIGSCREGWGAGLNRVLEETESAGDWLRVQKALDPEPAHAGREVRVPGRVIAVELVLNRVAPNPECD